MIMLAFYTEIYLQQVEETSEMDRLHQFFNTFDRKIELNIRRIVLIVNFSPALNATTTVEQNT